MTSQHRRRPDSREFGIVQRVRASLRLVPTEHPHILLACSGGKESVALALILGELRRLNLLSLTIAHVHHGQHHMADAAAQTVEEIGRMLGVPVVVRHLVRGDIAGHAGVGLEEAMRRERYLSLGTIARDLGADAIALAHHQADQAETVLLHLLRGSGLNGLAGMREWEARSIPWWNGTEPEFHVGIWRPFIHEPADDVADVAATSGFPVIDDPTNTDTAFRRNAIRHELLPVVETISPGSTAAISRAAHLVAADVNLLNELTARHLDSCREEDLLIRWAVVDLPVALQRRVVRTWLESMIPGGEFPFNRITAVLDMAHRNRGGARVEVGHEHEVVLIDGFLALRPWQNRR